MKKLINSFLFSMSVIMGTHIGQAAEKKVLFDFLHADWADTNKPHLSTAQEAEILNAVLGRRWRENKDIRPTVDEAVNGSFTKRNQKEIAYIVGGVDDHTPRPGKRFAVFSGDKLVLNKPFDGVGILKVTDLNSDGINEFLLWSGSTGMGESTTSAELVVVEKGSWTVIRDFGLVEDSYCDTSIPLTDRNRDETCILTYYIEPSRHQYPNVTEEFYVAPCQTNQGKGRDFSRFRRMTEAEVQDFLRDQ